MARILVIGGGGREHALIWSLSNESADHDLFCAPGNPGTAELGTNLAVDILDNDAVQALCVEYQIDSVIVGPEGPLANGIVDLTGSGSPVFVLALLIIVTMTLSDVMNNTATAVIAAPIAVNIADRLEVSPDPFLMGVAVAASCAFLTPIGHKNNTLIMRPGGYRFGDYWRMGLPLEILIIVVAVPSILMFWPL